uniref:Stabilin 1 n=1 Tax=Varanus komodoensis TaxID=61221 RepID=A0A8D2LJL2_VARKO
ATRDRGCSFLYFRYTVKLSGETLSLQGCTYLCKKDMEEEQCCPGFWGSECYECPGGRGNVCGGHGVCLDGVTQNGTCICMVSRSISKGQGDSVCECQHGICNHGPSGDGSCTCYAGYTGPKCDQVPQRCWFQGRCPWNSQTSLQIPSCSLLTSFTAQDPCSSSPCSVFATCKAVAPIDYECTCKEGYHGNGRICQPINPCLTDNGGCPKNSTICAFERSSLEENLCKTHIILGQHLWSDLVKTRILRTLSGHTVTFTSQNCDMPSILDNPGPFTVFVPSNEAVDKLRDGRLIYLFTQCNTHFVFQVKAEKLVTMPHILTMANQMLTVRISEDGKLQLGDAAVALSTMDIVASNGVIHLLDGIFIPPSIVPILPNRCSELHYRIKEGSCVDCGALNTSICPPDSKPVVKNLYYLCVVSGDVLHLFQTPGCCKGFFGPNCIPCPGGFSNACYGRGECSGGIKGNGQCHCFPGFKGIACHICSDPNKHGKNCDEDCGCIHGICDNRPGSRGVCQPRTCKAGYSGEFCDKSSHNCGPPDASLYCHVNAVCSINTTARCICLDGYEGDGFSCKPIDICSEPEWAGCSENAVCTRTGPGTATCQCNKGWTGDGKACVAIDNCAAETRGGCHANADCNYIGPGQSSCVCKQGYDGDGYSCDPIDPCLTDNGGCHELAVCQTRGPGEKVCQCPEGYMGDGTLCYGDVIKRLSLCAKIIHISSQGNPVSLKCFSWPVPVQVIMFLSYHRAHILQGSFMTEQLKAYVGQELSTLNPQTRWRISNSSGGNSLASLPCFPCVQVLLPASGNVPPTLPGLQQQLNATPSFSQFKDLLEVSPSAEWYLNIALHIWTHALLCNSTWTEDKDTVLYHVVPGDKFFPEDLKNGVHRSTMLGFSYWLMFYKDTNQTYVNKVLLEGPVVETRNGMLIGVSQVLQIQKNRCTANITTVEKVNLTPICSSPKVSLCCPGYYGHMCEMCPGKPGSWCSGNGECQDGTDGSGECRCREGFHGTACEMCQPGRYSTNCSLGEYCWRAICSDGLLGNGSCECAAGFEGPFCEQETDLCTVANGGCSKHAYCAKAGAGRRTCTCKEGYAGDGTLCRGECHAVRTLYCGCVSSYTLFSVQEAGLLSVVNNTLHQPFTMLWPTDAAFNSLPLDMQKWLYHKDHRSKLAAYLKGHIIREKKVSGALLASQLTETKALRTFHGSTISFSCGKTSAGDILVDNGNAQIVQRYMKFDVGIAYGIDHLLEPSDLGSRCDEFPTRSFQRVLQCSKPKDKSGVLLFLQGESQSCTPSTGSYFNSGWSYHRRKPYWWQTSSRANRMRLRTKTSLRYCKRTCFETKWIPQCCANHYGKDCLVCPGGLEAPCSNHGTCDDGHPGSGRCNCSAAYIGTACEHCSPGRYGPDCKECNCSENGICNEGLLGDGFCFCAAGWTGENCEVELAALPQCSPACHRNAVCRANNTCECNLNYEGDGRTCTVIDLCGNDNGGCSYHANCTQVGTDVFCSCFPDYEGDGSVCLPIDRCADGRNGDCSEHATCIYTGPNSRRCECKVGYVGNGIQCLEEAVPPTDRCLEDNGQCHPDAVCTDLHFHDKTAGVFHLQSPGGKYSFTYQEAEAGCAAEGATMATLQQLSAAQQMGLHLCIVGWLYNRSAGYPTVYPSKKCGAHHVGIVDYGYRMNASEKWDAYCYRAQDVQCYCGDGFLGDGYMCVGSVLAVLAQHANLSVYYSMILDYANATQEGLDFFNFLSRDTSYKTLFAPLNSGFGDNTVRSRECALNYSISAGGGCSGREEGDTGRHLVLLPCRAAHSSTSAPRTALRAAVPGLSGGACFQNERGLQSWQAPFRK